MKIFILLINFLFCLTLFAQTENEEKKQVACRNGVSKDTITELFFSSYETRCYLVHNNTRIMFFTQAPRDRSYIGFTQECIDGSVTKREKFTMYKSLDKLPKGCKINVHIIDSKNAPSNGSRIMCICSSTGCFEEIRS